VVITIIFLEAETKCFGHVCYIYPRTLKHMKQVNIIIGRFQPITTGHVKCAQRAIEKTKCPTVLLMIDTPTNKVDERHPFPSGMLLPMYKDLFKKNPLITDIFLVKNADIVKASEICAEHGYEIRSWSCGTDRIDSYTKMSAKYAEQANLPANFEMIEIKRGDEDESATKLRQALIADDKQTFFASFPTINLSTRLQHNIYDELRTQILSVVNK